VAAIAVVIGQPVSAMATAEVLVSRTVVDLVAGPGIEFDDRGEHELKGVPRKWQCSRPGLDRPAPLTPWRPRPAVADGRPTLATSI
jgi:class 3 adenylate cyclase